MDILTVKESSDGTQYIVNGNTFTSKTDSNRHYRIIQEWIGNGGVVEPFETAEETQARLDAEHNAQIKAELDELDRQSIRDIREWVASQPNAPQTLKDREIQAASKRANLK